MTIRFASVCSGVGTDHLAWSPLGWKSAWFSEIDPAASAILAYQFANVPNVGDMVKICEDLEAGHHTMTDVQVLGGGTPCQAFSYAGLRQSLGDARGNLSLVFCRIVHAIDHLRHARGHAAGLPVVVWENVPGVFSAPGNAFGCILAGLVGAEQPVLPDGGWRRAGLVVGPRRSAAYRVLDAQYFGLAQRRERVVVVSCSRASGLDPCEILFESEGVRRDHPPSRLPGENVTGTVTASLGERGTSTQDARQNLYIASTLTGGGRTAGGYSEDDIPHVTHALTAEGHDASEDGTGRGTPLVARAILAHHGHGDADTETFIVCQSGEISHPLTTRCGAAEESCEGSGNGAPLIPLAFGISSDAIDRSGEGADGSAAERSGLGISEEVMPALKSSHAHAVATHWAVRRITPREGERLQGLPDDHTLVPHRSKPMKDGPRYKCIGNGWAMPVFAWVGKRIDAALRKAGYG